MSWAGEVQGGNYSVLVKKDDGQSFPSQWLPNSCRFATEAEADAFIKNLKATWQPEGFIHSTRTVKSMDLVTHRWSTEKLEAVLLPAAPANEPMVMAAADIEQESEEDYSGPLEEPDEEPAALVDEERYRPRPANKKLPKQRLPRELLRGYRDETKWYEREQQFETSLADTPKGYGTISSEIRHDLRHLLAHGNCRFEISRRLLDFYMAAHGGKAPDKSIDTGKRRLNASKKKLFEAYEALRIAPENTKAQSAYRAAEKSYAATGGDLHAWWLATSGEIVGADDNGPIRVEPPAMKNIWEILRVSKLEFDWEAAAPAVSMSDLTRWLGSAEGHAAIGWYAFGEWHGPAKTLKDLIAALNIKPKLSLSELEETELAAKLLDRRNLVTRMERFESSIVEPEFLQTVKQQLHEKEYESKCKLPNLQKLMAKHGGDYSHVSMKEWDQFNREIEAWKDCVGCNDNWSEPNWRRWFARKTAEIWGDY